MPLGLGFLRSPTPITIVLTAATSTPAIVVNGGATTANALGVSLHFNVSGADQMRVACDDLLDTETAVPFQADVKCNLANTQGLRTIQARFLDLAGNQLAPPDAQLILDTVLPGVPAPKPIASPTKTAILALDWTPNASDTARYRLQVADSSAFAASDVDTTVVAPPYSFTARDGTWYWRVGAIDAAGNASAWSATTQASAMIWRTTAGGGRRKAGSGSTSGA